MLKSVDKRVDIQYLHEFNGWYQSDHQSANMLYKHDIKGYFNNIKNTINEEKQLVSSVCKIIKKLLISSLLILSA